MDVRNDSAGWLVLWLEPLGEDRWLQPGETFRVRSDYQGDDVAFLVDFWVNNDDLAADIENVTVWIEQGNCYAEVTDTDGQLIECGHRRPAEVQAKWTAMLDRMGKPVDGATHGSGPTEIE